MKRLAILLTLIALTAPATANMQCGFKPFKPLGCGPNAYAQCQCDSDGNCRWVWVNC